MKLFTAIFGKLLGLTKYRFSKKHRHNESILYRTLNTTAMNQIASGLSLKEFFKIYGVL